jgi:hypothetical protein
MDSRFTALIGIIVLLFIGFSASVFLYMNAVQKYSNELKEMDAQVGERESRIAVLEASAAEVADTKIICSDCHGEVRSFHTVEKVTALDRIRGVNPRICTNCHGANPHEIHNDRIVRGKLTCDDCHLKDAEVVIPEVQPGDILICEQCHLDGNYVDIHVDFGGGTCSSCHVGDVGNIHRHTIANVEDLLEQNRQL